MTAKQKGLVSIIVALFFTGEICFAAVTTKAACKSAREAISKSTVAIYEVHDGDFYVSGEIVDSKEGKALSFDFFLRTKQSRSTNLSGKKEFKKMLEHFDGQFDHVQGLFMRLEGKRDVSDNLDRFNQLTSPPHNLSPDEAALKVWTGERATEAGYGDAEVVETAGRPGHYTYVRVVYRKSVQP